MFAKIIGNFFLTTSDKELDFLMNITIVIKNTGIRWGKVKNMLVNYHS